MTVFTEFNNTPKPCNTLNNSNDVFSSKGETKIKNSNNNFSRLKSPKDSASKSNNGEYHSYLNTAILNNNSSHEQVSVTSGKNYNDRTHEQVSEKGSECDSKKTKDIGQSILFERCKEIYNILGDDKISKDDALTVYKGKIVTLRSCPLYVRLFRRLVSFFYPFFMINDKIEINKKINACLYKKTQGRKIIVNVKNSHLANQDEVKDSSKAQKYISKDWLQKIMDSLEISAGAFQKKMNNYNNKSLMIFDHEERRIKITFKEKCNDKYLRNNIGGNISTFVAPKLEKIGRLLQSCKTSHEEYNKKYANYICELEEKLISVDSKLEEYKSLIDVSKESRELSRDECKIIYRDLCIKEIYLRWLLKLIKSNRDSITCPLIKIKQKNIYGIGFRSIEEKLISKKN